MEPTQDEIDSRAHFKRVTEMAEAVALKVFPDASAALTVDEGLSVLFLASAIAVAAGVQEQSFLNMASTAFKSYASAANKEESHASMG